MEKGQHLPRPAVTVQLLHGRRLPEQRPVGTRHNERFEPLRIPARRGDVPHEVSGTVDMGEQRVERTGAFSAKSPFGKRIGQYPARGTVEDIQGIRSGTYERIHRNDILSRTAPDPSHGADVAAVFTEEPDALSCSERFAHDRTAAGQRRIDPPRQPARCPAPATARAAPRATRKLGKGDRVPLGEGVHRPPVVSSGRRPNSRQGKRPGSAKQATDRATFRVS